MGVRARLLLAGLLVIGVAVAVLLVLRPEPEEPPRLDRGGTALPVILVHGYGGGSTSMDAIEARLRREGRQVVSVDLPEGGVGDILESARHVAGVVEGTG